MSKAYIACCSCTKAGGASMNIAACFNQGDSDYLFVGRHGVFYDRKGQAWDAVITSIVGLIIVVSGPSMLIAWLKLRQRTLGPILEGNGWAVNGRVKINIPFGTALTDLAVKPAGSKLSLEDPYEDKEAASRRRRIAFLVVLLALTAAAAWTR